MLINIFRAHFGPPKSTAAFASCLRWTRFISSYPTLDLIQNKPRRESNKIAIRDEFGAITYKDLFTKAYEISTAMKEVSGRPLIGERVTFFANNNRSSAQTLLAAWINGSVAVPLCTSHPISEKEYFIKDSDATLLVGDFENAEELKVLSESTGVKYLLLSDIVSTNQSTLSEKSINQITEDDSALIVYTSGTTGRPKGVLHTHSTLSNTITDMITSWYWTSSDHCLHSLPLHHVHGLINALLVPLSVNASVYMLPKFNPKQFWDVLLDNDIGITITTAVPTIYAKLLQYHRENKEKTDEQVRHAAKDIRLMISGSSGLPVPVFNDWIELTGHVLIERYGMTETCMTLTNKITSNGVLVTGTIGVPFPSVQTCIAREDDSLPNGYEDVSKQTDPETGMSLDGELYVKGGSVFKEYWRKPEATRRAFTSDGWFKTGDTMCIDGGYYKILGRTSVDIIKSGGFKISALDIENKLLTHPDIIECCVLGKPDNVYGQTVAAVIVSEADLTKDSLSSWCSDKMPKYHIPTTVVKLNSIPRNAMGKINKKSLTKELFGEAS